MQDKLGNIKKKNTKIFYLFIIPNYNKKIVMMDLLTVL